MAVKYLIKNPLFITGILLLYLLYAHMEGKGFFASRNKKLMATSCKSIQFILTKRAPSSWDTQCENGHTLFVEIQSELSKKEEGKENELRPKLYRELANSLTSLAKITAYYGFEGDNPLKKDLVANPKALMRFKTSKQGVQEVSSHESLERTVGVRLLLRHPDLSISAYTSGADVAKLTTLNDPKAIATHIHNTVMVQEQEQK